MNRQTYLQIGLDVLPIDKNDYTIEYTDIETDRTTEIGTTSREIVREGKIRISTSFTVTQAWYAKLRGFKASPTLTVSFFNPGTGTTENATMWVTAFSAALVMDRSSEPVFAISMTLEEY